MTASRFALRISTFYAGYFIFAGVNLPFFPVWLHARGLTDVEIAQVIAIPVLIRVLLTPVAGWYADRAPNRRFAVITFTLPAAIIFLAAWPATGYWPLLLTTGIAFILFGLAGPPVDALALTGVRRYGVDFGRMRMFGSSAFIATNVGAGALLGFLDPERIYVFLLAGLVSAVAVSFLLPVTPPEVRALDNASRPDADTRHWREVLGDTPFLGVLLGAGLVHGSCGLLYAFGSIAWQRMGYSGLEIGAFWAFGIGAEVLVLFFARSVLRGVSARTLVIAGAIATAIRWLLFPVVPGLGFSGFAVLQSLHGFTFSATYIGIQQIITRHVPERMTASAQGIFAMLVGLILALTTWVAGPIYEAFGLNGFYAVAPMPVLALVIYLIAGRIFPRQARANATARSI